MEMKSKILPFLLILPLLFSSCGNNANKDKKGDKVKTETKDTTVMESKLAFDPATLPEEPVFEIVTSEGTIVVKLYKDTPLHRDNFVKLASQKFFDNIRFHRVINHFMIQTGDPLSKDLANSAKFGTGGPGYTIPAEIVPDHLHKKGALAAARRGDAANPKRESSGSQFYIVQDERTCKQLDGQYTVFGETIDGFDVIEKIATTPTDQRDRPTKDIMIISIKPVL